MKKAILSLLALSLTAAQAKVTLPNIFASGMVMQQQTTANM